MHIRLIYYAFRSYIQQNLHYFPPYNVNTEMAYICIYLYNNNNSSRQKEVLFGSFFFFKHYKILPVLIYTIAAAAAVALVALFIYYNALYYLTLYIYI